MRKFVLMALAGLALALAAPITASAAPVTNGEAIRAAADGIAPTEDVRHRRWHCRWRSGYCGRARPYYYAYPRYRYRYYRPYRYYYAPRYRYRYYHW